MRLEKSYKADVKPGGDEGIVEMYVSMFGNVDHVGDRVIKGAFAKSLEGFKSAGDPIPFIWNHDWDNPDSHIGKVLDAQETDEGLKVTAQLDMGEAKAAKVFRLLKERRVREASFAYDVVRERKSDDGANELVELNLIECGPTTKGANSETRVLATKSEDEILAKVGRVLSSKSESGIKQAIDLLNEVLSQVSTEEMPAKSEAKSLGDDESLPTSPSPRQEIDLNHMALDMLASSISQGES